MSTKKLQILGSLSGTAELVDGSVQTAHLADGVVTQDKTSYIVAKTTNGKNLFDKTAAQTGVIANSVAGLTETASYFTSDFIPIIPTETYCLSLHYPIASTLVVAFYASNDPDAKTLCNPYASPYTGLKLQTEAILNGSTVVYTTIGNHGLIEAPAEATYLRFCMFPQHLNRPIQFEKNTFPTSYAEHGTSITEYYLDGSVILQDTDGVNNIRASIDGLDERIAMVEKTSAGDPGELGDGSVLTEHIADGAVTPEKVSFITAKPVTGTNLYNKEAAIQGQLVQTGGVDTTKDGWTSDYIAVDPTKTYCWAIHDYPQFGFMYGFYATNEETAVPTQYKNAQKSQHTTIIDGFSVPYVLFGEDGDYQFDVNTKYLRVWGNNNAMQVKNAQIEEGNVPTVFEPFGVSKYEYHLDESIKVSGTAERDEEQEEETKPLSVTINDNTISLVGKLGESQTIQIDGQLKYAGGNDQFNLTKRIISKNGVVQISDNSANDDLPPLTLYCGSNVPAFGVGANHNYELIGVVDSTGALANYVGQIITSSNDGSAFALVDFDAATNKGVFLASCSEDANGLWQKSAAKITAGDVLDLPDGMTVDAGAVSTVRFKTVNHHKYSFIVDGVETEEHKNYSCDTFTIKETYDIISYKGVWDYYAEGDKAGVSYYDAREEFPVCMTIENIYTFDSKCSMVVNTTFRAVEKIKIQQAGIIQNYLLAKETSDVEYMYVNKAFEKNGVNLSSLVNVNDLPASTIEFKGTEFGADGVANRNVLWVTSESGEKKYGLTTGFIPDLSYSKDSQRKSLLGAIWQVYHTKKSYPYGVRVKTMNVGDSLTCLAYRSYLPEETPVTNFNIVDVGDTAYLFIDAHEAGTFTVEMASKYHNRVIDIVEQSNITLASDVVGNTITFTVSGDKGYATVKLRDGVSTLVDTNSQGTFELTNGCVQTAHIADEAVTANKLSADIPFLMYSLQTLTEDQKEQARNNIDAASKFNLSSTFAEKYSQYNIPTVYFTGDVSQMTKENSVSLGYVYGDMSGTCTLKWQGSSSITYPKKNYTVKFDTEFEARDGWGEQKKYCLKADWIDFSHCRNVVSAKLWGEFVKSRGTVNSILASLPNAGAIDGFPCFVVINGVWQGIYNFNIPKDDWMMGMGSGEKEAILCAGNNTNGSKFKAQAVVADNSDFEPEYNSDTFAISEVQDSLNTLISAVINSDGTDIDTTIAQYLDIDSAIDYYIFMVACGGTDIVTKNYILATYDGIKWFFSAYDLDSTWGMAYDGQQFFASGYTEGGPNDVKFKRMYEQESHLLFKLLYENKKADIIKRYNQLRERVLTASNISKLFTNYIGRVPKIAFDAENEVWTGIPSTGTNSVMQIVNWASDRLDAMDREILEMSNIIDDNKTDGLAYRTEWDGKKYHSICTGIGSATSADITIAQYHSNYPVDSIKNAAFQNNTTIESVIIQDGMKTIGVNAFNGTTNLANIELPHSIETFGSSVFLDSGITKLFVPKNVTTLPDYVAARSKVSELVMGNRVHTISGYAFQNCQELTKVKLSNNLRNIGLRAFRLCGKLEYILLPSSLVTIGDNAFDSCGLKEIIIPENVKSIGAQAFSYCTSCSSVIFRGTPTSIGSNAFNALGNNAESVDIYVPWAEGAVSGAPWGATKATVHYNSNV